MSGEVWRMNFLDLARAIFALAFTLGIIGLAAWASRRYLPQLLARISAERGERRMTVVDGSNPVTGTRLIWGGSARVLMVSRLQPSRVMRYRIGFPLSSLFAR